jgi:hypothetical protein
MGDVLLLSVRWAVVPGIHITFPTEEEEDLLRRFTVNRNYLAGLAGFLGSTYGRGADLYGPLQTIVQVHRPYHKIQRVEVPLEDVRRFLILGWTSEIQLHLPSFMGNEATIGFANAWAPVHAYYAAFGLLQAWFAANGMGGTANDHTATLRTIGAMIRERNLFPQPWNLLAIGCPMRGQREHLNDEGVDCTSHVEVLASPVPTGTDPTFWARYGTWLRSTRAARLEAREQEWKVRNGKQRISPSQRTKIADALAPTSVFDCFWRMRIKSNYGTIDPYLASQISAIDHQIFNRSLFVSTGATVGLLELYVAQRIGAETYAGIARDFLRHDGAHLADDTLRARCAAFGFDLDA